MNYLDAMIFGCDPQPPPSESGAAMSSALAFRDYDIWRAALTLAHNICVQESDRINGEDGSLEAVNATADCAKRIRGWIEATEEQLREMFEEAGVRPNTHSPFKHQTINTMKNDSNERQEQIAAGHANISMGLMRQAQGIALVKSTFDHLSDRSSSEIKKAKETAAEFLSQAARWIEVGFAQLLECETAKVFKVLPSDGDLGFLGNTLPGGFVGDPPDAAWPAAYGECQHCIPCGGMGTLTVKCDGIPNTAKCPDCNGTGMNPENT